MDLLPPCNYACPAGENVQAWLDLAQAGKYRQAWEVLVRDNPMPAIHGRVCYHPCENACNRGEIDLPVSVHAVERFLGIWLYRRTGRSGSRERPAIRRCSSLAPVRLDFRQPIILPVSVMKWKSMMQDPFPEA